MQQLQKSRSAELPPPLCRVVAMVEVYLARHPQSVDRFAKTQKETMISVAEKCSDGVLLCVGKHRFYYILLKNGKFAEIGGQVNRVCEKNGGKYPKNRLLLILQTGQKDVNYAVYPRDYYRRQCG